jgi:hypothetical protein
MAVVKVANLLSICKENAIAQPIESICQDDFALCSFGGSVDSVHSGNLVADPQVDLALVRVGESVWLPKRHVTIIAGK